MNQPHTLPPGLPARQRGAGAARTVAPAAPATPTAAAAAVLCAALGAAAPAAAQPDLRIGKVEC